MDNNTFFLWIAWGRQRPLRCAGVLALLLSGSAVAAPTPPSAYGQLPLSFEPNQGQTAPEVRFLSRGPGYQLFLTPQEAVLTLHKSAPKGSSGKPTSARPPKTEGTVVRMHLDGANPTAAISGQSPLPGKVNYLRGNDPKQWRTDIPTYEKVKYTNVYPGIDLVYYGRERQLEYDFIVAPGADPKAIALTFSGGELQLSDSGDLVLATATGEVRFQKPVLYQEIGGRQQPVEGRYVRRGAEHIGFEVGAYDATRPLVIDPVLSYSTYLGGSDGEYAEAIAVDARGQTYVTGSTLSPDFPLQSPIQSEFKGDPDLDLGSGYLPPTDAFVAKINSAGTALIYATYLGGRDGDAGRSIVVDPRGQAYVTGSTQSEDFPTTPNSLQPILGGGFDTFVAKLNSAGTAFVYSTYLGGRGSDGGHGIAVNPRGQAYVTGNTSSEDFPIKSSLQPVLRGSSDAFVAKLNASGDVLIYSTYLGGSNWDWGESIAVDSHGHAYIAGSTRSDDFPTRNPLQPVQGGYSDAFIAKLNPEGKALVYSTYLGGSDWEDGHGIAVDSHGHAYAIGKTRSDDFPTTKQALQPASSGQSPTYGNAFVAKLSIAGNTLVYSTYLGGSGGDDGTGIAVDPHGHAHVTGWTWSSDFPTQNPLQAAVRGGGIDAFVAKLNAAGTTLIYSTYLGGYDEDRGMGIAVDPRGHAYVAGDTWSEDFPVSPRVLQPVFGGGVDRGADYLRGDAFVSKITHRGK